jgi:hypothetical protein
MEIIDAQIHSWETKTDRPWDGSGPAGAHVELA